MKTNELTGAALDWAVAKCFYIDRAFEPTEGKTTVRVLRTPENTGEYHSDWFMFRPSTDWAQGGTIIEQEGISTAKLEETLPDALAPHPACWSGHIDGVFVSYGPTPLIAAMRCYVSSKLGYNVDIPEELTA